MAGRSVLKPDRAFLRPFQLAQFLHHLRPRPAQGQAAILTQQAPRLLMQHFHSRVIDEVDLLRFDHHPRAVQPLQAHLQVMAGAKKIEPPTRSTSSSPSRQCCTRGCEVRLR